MNARERDEEGFYLDERHLLSEFLLSPNINDDADFSHIDKNLSITRLSSRFREPEVARGILNALHVLNNPKYFYETKEEAIVGYEEKELIVNGKKAIKTVPRVETITVRKNKYPKTFHNLKSKFFSLVTTASARDGHLIRTLSTRKIERSDSIEEKTSAKPNWFGFSNSSNNRNERGY